MKTTPFVHRWDVTPHEAIAIQEKLRASLSLQWDSPPIGRAGGVDCSSARGADEGYGVVVVMEWLQLDEIDMAWTRKTISFPYIPGLLTFDQRVTSGLPSAALRPLWWEENRRWEI